MNNAFISCVKLEFLLGTKYLDYGSDTYHTRKEYNRKYPVDPFPNNLRQVKDILDYPHQN